MYSIPISRVVVTFFLQNKPHSRLHRAARSPFYFILCSAKNRRPLVYPFRAARAAIYTTYICNILYVHKFAVNLFNNILLYIIYYFYLLLYYNTVLVCIIICPCVRVQSVQPLCPGANAFFIFLPHCSRAPSPSPSFGYVRGRRWRTHTYEPTGRARAGRDVAGAAENVPAVYTRGDRGRAEVSGHYIVRRCII